jgi:hypothetical protein
MKVAETRLDKNSDSALLEACGREPSHMIRKRTKMFIPPYYQYIYQL